MEKIKSSRISDLPSIAHCHSVAFPSSLAAALGQRYLTHMLSWYLSSNRTFILHIEDKLGGCLGYCGGMVDDGTLHTGSASGMAQHSFNAAIQAFLLRPWLIFHPEVRAKWPLLWRNIQMKLGLRPRVHFSAEQKSAKVQNPQVGLVVIGVNPAYQGKGYGSLLLQEFERKAVEDYGITKLQLTVKANNAKAIRAYERNGWQRGDLNGTSLQMTKTVTT